MVFDLTFKKEKKFLKKSVCMQKSHFRKQKRVKVFKKVYLYPKKCIWYSKKIHRYPKKCKMRIRKKTYPYFYGYFIMI